MALVYQPKHAQILRALLINHWPDGWMDGRPAILCVCRGGEGKIHQELVFLALQEGPSCLVKEGRFLRAVR